MKVSLIIPAHNEEAAIGAVLDGVSHIPFHQKLVVANGCTDNTGAVARSLGAIVIEEPRLGYGQACLTGISNLNGHEIILFLDGDGSDSPDDVPKILEPILLNRADFVIGARRDRERGSMTVPQRFGNWLATRLIWLLWGHRYFDLGPMRAIRKDALEKLEMTDKGFGWTVEMQIRAIEEGLRIQEVPVSYRKRRGGVSKISGTVRGVIGAGTKILWTIGFYRVRGLRWKLSKWVQSGAP
jgi:glycosyltransferase involved in cell wall biosynthesis